MNKKIIAYLLSLSLCQPAYTQQSTSIKIPPTKSRITQFKERLESILKRPITHARFLFNWAKKKRAGIETSPKDDRRAYRLLGGSAGAIAALAAIAVSISSGFAFRTYKRVQNLKKKIDLEKHLYNNYLVSDVNEMKAGMMPLHRAIFLGKSLNDIQYLIDNKADVNAKAELRKGAPYSGTPLDYCNIYKCNDAIINLLKNLGAEVKYHPLSKEEHPFPLTNQGTNRSPSIAEKALWDGVENGDLALIKTAIEQRNINPNITNKDGKSPLDLANALSDTVADKRKITRYLKEKMAPKRLVN